MKKAKVILSAIAVLAVVGGALAFKAKSQNYCLFTKTGEFALSCPSRAVIETTEAGSAVKWATTVQKIGNCPAEVSPEKCTFTFNTVIE